MNMMQHLKKLYTNLTNACLSVLAWSIAWTTSAQIYSGGGIEEGVDEASELVGGINLREKILDILRTVLSYMALIAVVVIIIAGIRLVVSQGEEEQKEKAKRTVIYAIIGLLIILLARGIVEVVASIGT